jgi:hypothetical protein
MPLTSRLVRIARLLTLAETRGLIVAVAHSTRLRTVAHRAVNDRRALARDLVAPANARALVHDVVHHPAVAELANVGLMFLPGRYLPLGWAATWLGRRVLRRPAGRP